MSSTLVLNIFTQAISSRFIDLSLDHEQTITLYGVFWYNIRWDELETVGVISFG